MDKIFHIGIGFKDGKEWVLKCKTSSKEMAIKEVFKTEIVIVPHFATNGLYCPRQIPNLRAADILCFVFKSKEVVYTYVYGFEEIESTGGGVVKI